MNPQDVDIRALLPQQPPMVMVDKLLECEPVVTRTAFTVREDNIMVDDGCLSAYGLIENIAQTCAARIGYVNITNGGDVKVGVIGALRDITIGTLPRVGSMIETTIEVGEEVFGMTLAHATTRCNGEVVADGTIKIALLG